MNADRPNPSAFIKPSVWIFVCTVIIPLTILFLSAKFFNLKHGDVRAFSVPEKLLIVFAHTDDEVTNSGLIRHWANLGTEIKILTLTDGSANPDSDLKTCKPAENITGCRIRELSESARTLGIRHIRTPLLPDSKLLQALPQATQIVLEELANFRPDAVMTMEPSGLNGLADHRAAFLSVAAAAAQTTIKFRAFLSALPPPFEWFLPSRIPENRQTSVKTFTTDGLLRSAKTAVANAHQSQSKTIRGLTLGLGADKLFTWINFETYGIFDSGDLSALVPKNN